MGFKISASKICFLSLAGAFHNVIVDGYSVVRIVVMVLNISFLEESLMGMQEFWLRVRLDTAENWKLKLKTEKHCSKIIFKYVNSIVGPIFSEKVAEKWNLWVREQYTMCCDWSKKIWKVKVCGYCSLNSAWTVAATPKTPQNAWEKKNVLEKRKRRIGQKTPNPNAL